MTDLQVSQSGAYTVVVSNSFGVVTSGSAELTEIPWPIIQPPSQTNLIGTTASFSANYDGGTPLSYQWYFDGTNLSDGGQFSGAATSVLSISNVQKYNIGSYQVVIDDAGSMKTSSPAFLTVTNYSSVVRYVNQNNPTPSYPYLDWNTAATNIQDAIDAAFDGDLILVTNGIYTSDGTMSSDGVNNCIVVTNAITLESVNGTASTGINGMGLMRCVYLADGAILSGFTLTNGATQASGGGLRCESTNALIIDCEIISNAAASSGGGVYFGTLSNCTLTGNRANYGGGAQASTLNNCMLMANSTGFMGGGAAACTLNNCTLAGNYTSRRDTYGGGAARCTLNNCLLTNNTCGNEGGGSFQGTLNNCTLTGNSATNAGGGAYDATLNNCTLTGNSAQIGGGAASSLNTNFNNCIIYYNNGGNCYRGALVNCCTTPLGVLFRGSANNITNEPLFVNLAGGDFHLQFNSPCINSGNNGYVAANIDLDGNPRIVGGTVDIGAYEYQTPVSQISYAWLQQYGLPINTNTDTADFDHDGLNNYQEWIAGTNPTNALSVLEMLSPIPTNNPSGLVLGWESVNNRTYFLQSSTNLGAQQAFSTIQSNIVGQTGTTGYMDTNAMGNGPYFYRVGVQQ